ncbi:hypothetical protein CFRS1_v013431 [Colletotrichum fructicola]|nr:hypothetical protein CFRS1_v013431 [Colletotrichum fructicola]
MEQWKAAGREIRSRCGFCNTTLESWASRSDHLADHFKAGKTMADWKGDWGFDPEVADTVENDMPPYLIHYERSTVWPISSNWNTPSKDVWPKTAVCLQTSNSIMKPAR